jgi:hypothetical protein
MAGFRGYVIGTITLIVFISFMFAFIGSFIQETNPESELLNENRYGIGTVLNSSNARLESITTQINSTSSQFASASVDPVSYLFLISKAMFEIPKTIFLFILGGITSLPTILFKGLAGTGAGNLLAFALSIITAVIVITLVLLGIKIIRTGESER